MATSGGVDDGPSVASTIISHDGSDSVLIAEPETLFLGDYSRQGDDLLITHDGAAVLVQGYFGYETSPALAAPNGAFLSADVVNALAGPLAPGQYAQAGGGSAPVQIGKVINLSGSANATHADGVSVGLKVGDPVFQGDVVQTGPGSKLGVSFLDDTVFSMSADARMVLDELVYDPANAANSSMVFNLVQGSFVFVTGAIAPTGNMKIDTPVATMGIRGTTPKLFVNADLGVVEFAILPDPGSGKIGSYVLIDKTTGDILGTVDSVGDKWVVTTLSDEAVRIAKSGNDLLEDELALADIREAVSRALGQRTETTGTKSFETVAFNASASTTPGDGQDGPNDGQTPGETPGDGDPTADPDDAPIAGDDAFTTNEDLVLSGKNVIAGSDVDPDGFALTVSQVNGVALTFNANGLASVVLPANADFQTVGANLLISETGGITYDPSSAFNYLAVGEVATDTFTYTTRDKFGYTDTATVTITIEGRNDTPIITVADPGDVVGTINDVAEQDPSGNSDLTETGSITFGDVDLSDRPLATVSEISVTATAQGSTAENPVALPLTTQQIAAIAEAFKISPDGAVGDNTNNGTVNWNYTIDENDVDFLGAGEVVTAVFTIKVDDGHGGAATQNVTITINGANAAGNGDNDAPVISVESGDAAVAGLSETNAGLTVSDTLTVSEVDLTDQIVTSVVFVNVGGSGPSTGQPANPALLGMLTLSPSPILTDNTSTSGKFTWTFNSGSQNFDYLADGETLVLTYTVKATDDELASDTQTVTITITGTNDAPVIEAASVLADTIDEQTDETGSGDVLTAGGTIAFSDVDITDEHSIPTPTLVSVVWSNGNQAVSNPGALVIDPVDQTGNSADWTYSVTDGALDYLADGETLTVTYAVTVRDDSTVGASDTSTTQQIVVTITGTNDVPVVAAGDVTGGVTELTPEDDPVAALTDTGTIAFSDVDLTDGHTIDPTIVHSVDALGVLTASVTTDTTGTGLGGVITWNYSVDPALVEYLAEGESKVETFTITLDDGNGGTVERTIEVIIQGTNDAPVVAAGDVTGGVTELTPEDDPVAELTDTGTIAFSDVDLTDEHEINTTIVPSVDALGVLTASVTTDTTGTGLGGVISWNYSVDAADVEYLAEGESKVETFTIKLDDGNGGTIERTIEVTITGTNDAPVAVASSAGAVEDTAQSFLAANFGFSDPVDGTDDALQAVIITGLPGHGTLLFDGQPVETGDSFLASDLTGSRLSYLSAENYSGEDSFTFKVQDDAGGDDTSVASATMTINVEAVADAPLVQVIGSVPAQPVADGLQTVANTTTLSEQESPSIAALAGGGYVIVWQSYSGTDFDIVAQRFDQSGNPLGGQITVNTTMPGHQELPAVTALDGGGFVVAWASSDGSGSGVYGQRFDANGVADGPEFPINNVTTGYQAEVSLAGLADGGFVATWASNAGVSEEIFAQRYNASGGEVGGEFQVNVTSTGSQRFPQAVALADGGFAIAWNSDGQDGSGIGAFFRVFDENGVAVTGDVQANTFETDNQRFVDVAALSDGGLVLIWQSDAQSGELADIYGQVFDASGQPVGDEFPVNTVTANNQTFPTVTALQDGGFVVSWLSDGSGAIKAQRFDYNGETVGSEFQVSSTAVNGLPIPQADSATLSDGTFVVTWHTISVDGDGDGVVFQRFLAPATVGPTTSITGVEDTPLALVDQDGSETISSIVVSGLPAGYSLSAGTESPAGTWTLTDAQLAGLTIMPPLNGNGSFQLQIDVTSQETVGGDAEMSTQMLDVIFAPVADAPLLSVSASGSGDGTPVAATSELRVNTDTDNLQNQVAVAALADGGSIVVWASFTSDLSGSKVYGQRFDANGDPVDSQFQVNTTTGDLQRYPAVAAVGDTGGFIVIWTSLVPNGSGNFTNEYVYAQVYGDDGTPTGTEFQITALAAGETVTELSDGNFLITWTPNDGNEVYGRIYSPAGVAPDPAFAINSTTTGLQNGTNAAAFEDGGFIVVWNHEGAGGDGDGYAIFGRLFDANGDAVDVQFQVNQTTTEHQLYADVAVLNDGRFVVVWQSGGGQDTSGIGIYARLYSAGGIALTDEFPVNTETDSNQSNPAVIDLDDGGFLVTWTSQNQDEVGGNGFYGQRFDSDGNAVGQEFLINETTVGNQTASASNVDMLENGNITFAWYGNGGGDSTGIFSRIFNLSGDDYLNAGELINLSITASLADTDNSESLSVTLTGLPVDFEVTDGIVAEPLVSAGTTDAIDLDGLDLSALMIAAPPAFDQVVTLIVTATSTESANQDEASTTRTLIFGSSQGDTLLGTDGDDLIFGGDGSDTLLGDVGADQLFGGDGADQLTGGDGADELTGGDGADEFVFLAATDGSLEIDQILDYDLAEGDVINLESLLGPFDPDTPADVERIDLAAGVGPNVGDSILRVDGVDVAVLHDIAFTETIQIAFNDTESFAFSNSFV